MSRNCNPEHFDRLNRRGISSRSECVLAAVPDSRFSAIAAAVQLGLSGDLKNYKNFEGTAKSIIHIFMPGGMAHQESFDPKPHAPIEYRGEMGQVATKNQW